jgi:hypothetical protein
VVDPKANSIVDNTLQYSCCGPWIAPWHSIGGD